MAEAPTKGKKSWPSWLGVGLCTLAIYAVIPMARPVQKSVSEHFGRSFFGILVLGAIAVGFAGVLYALIVRLKIRSVSNYAWLVLVAGLYTFFTVERWKVPEEAAHFLEYGLLGFFLYKALSFSVKDWTVYLDGIAAGSLIGFVDEIIQWAVPGRYWDFRDAGFNILSSVLFQIAVWQGIRPQAISGPVSPQSKKRLSVLVGANLVLIGLCLSNTPQRVAWYTAKIPGLAFLQNEEPMHEILHRHEDPEIGFFFSRLTLDGLARTDSERSQDFGRILDDWKNRDSGDFLRMFSVLHNPFLHEMRVHLFRRDKKLAEGEAASSPGKDAGDMPGIKLRRGSGNNQAGAKALFSAYKENLILEKYFGRTLKNSGYAWPVGRKDAIAPRIDVGAFYKSPVSAAGGGWLGRLKDGPVWTFIAACLFSLVFINRKRKPRP